MFPVLRKTENFFSAEFIRVLQKMENFIFGGIHPHLRDFTENEKFNFRRDFFIFAGMR